MTTSTRDSNIDDLVPTMASVLADMPISTACEPATSPCEGIIEPGDYAKFKAHKETWLPKLTGIRLDALRTKIVEVGQLAPILVDEKNDIWDGRARFEILKELGKPVRFLRIPSAQGLIHALAGNTNRDTTVLDDTMMVKWVKEKGLELIALKGNPEADTTNAKVSIWMIQHRGWQRRSSPRTIASYLKLSEKLKGATGEQRNAVAESATVNEALKAFKKSTPVVTPATKAIRAIKAMVSVLNKVGDLRYEGDDRSEVEKAKQKLEALLKLTSAA